jgi:tRNA pseudouridine38-40 synthase
MARWLLRFGYDGAGFYGWARQPGLRTVEDVLAGGLRRRGVLLPSDRGPITVASRTDRGVSARANAVVVSTALPPSELLRRLNTISPSLFFTAAREVSETFRVRQAVRRTYRYFDPIAVRDPELVGRAAALFAGPVDTRTFGRGVPPAVPRLLPVESVSSAPNGPGHTVEVRAPSFVWGMVRKIVGGLREVDAGRLSLALLEAAVRGRRRLTLPLAEPEGLVLWEVEYPEPWEVAWPGPNREQRAARLASMRSAWTRERMVEVLYGDPGRSPIGLGSEPAR